MRLLRPAVAETCLRASAGYVDPGVVEAHNFRTTLL